MDGDACVFYDLEGLRTGSVLALENELSLFANSEDEDVLRGSGVIVPKRHVATVFDLTPAEISATFALLGDARTLLAERYRPDG
jgi:diadenosine tetraphosphate (Ap4A) HIT family hydrolase